MPVLPLVASMTVCPGLSEPSRSAASITPSASRSLTEPSGLNASSFTNSSTHAGAMLLTRTTGVLPTVSSIDFLIPAIPCCLRYFRHRKRQGNVLHPAKSIVGPPAFIRAPSSPLRRRRKGAGPGSGQQLQSEQQSGRPFGRRQRHRRRAERGPDEIEDGVARHPETLVALPGPSPETYRADFGSPAVWRCAGTALR